MKKHCLIYGAGNIGYRHAQSLLNSNWQVSAYDISDANLRGFSDLGCEVFNDMDLSKQHEFDLVIFSATTKAFTDFICHLKKLTYKKLLIEKPLALTEHTIHFLQENSSNPVIRINSPYRFIENFKRLFDHSVNGSQNNLYCEISGPLCNFSHYVALFKYWTTGVFADARLENPSFIESKRPGYIELDSGALIFEYNCGQVVIQPSRSRDKITLSNSNGDASYFRNDVLEYQRSDGAVIRRKPLSREPYQSELTSAYFITTKGQVEQLFYTLPSIGEVIDEAEALQELLSKHGFDSKIMAYS